MTATPPDQLTLGDYLRVIRRRKWIILAVFLVVPLAAFAFAAHKRTTHKTTIQVVSTYLQPPNSTGGSSAGSSSSSADARYLAGEAAFAESLPVLNRAVKLAAANHVVVTAQQLAHNSAVTPSTVADILLFSVSRNRAGDASTLADAYARAYVAARQDQINQQYGQPLANLRADIARLQAQTKDPSTSKNEIRSIRPELNLDLKNIAPLRYFVNQSLLGVHEQPTTSSTVAVKTSPVKYAVGGALAGLVLGLIVAFIWDAIDNGSRARQQQLAGTLNLPVLGNLPAPPRRLRTDNRLVTMEHGEVGAEAFRLLAVRLGLLGAGAGSRSLVVTSALEEEGKSTTAANLSVALAQIGKSVVLLDGDLIRPTAARFFGAEGQAGLFEVLSGELGIDDVAVVVDVPAGQGTAGRLRVVPAGHVTSDATGLLASESLDEVLSALKRSADYVVVDSPPLLTVSHATVWAAKVDAVLVVARADKATPEVTWDLQAILDALPTPTLGVVLTGVDGSAAYPYYASMRAYQPAPMQANGAAPAPPAPDLAPAPLPAEPEETEPAPPRKDWPW
jgi:capsular exopolysaccharide synthesis family protein